MIVQLTAEEILGAVIVGARRLIVSDQKDLGQRDGKKRDWGEEIEGALGEAAVARVTGLFFDPRVGRYKTADVGPYHVRQTPVKNGRLIIRDDDPDGVYVLVTGEFGRYDVAGFIASEHARTMDDCRDDPNGRPAAWFIPQDRLDRMDVE